MSRNSTYEDNGRGRGIKRSYPTSSTRGAKREATPWRTYDNRRVWNRPQYPPTFNRLNENDMIRILKETLEAERENCHQLLKTEIMMDFKETISEEINKIRQHLTKDMMESKEEILEEMNKNHQHLVDRTGAEKRAICQANDDIKEDVLLIKEEPEVFNGATETQMLERGEKDVEQQAGACKKNKPHKGLIAVNNFNISYLPYGYKDPDLVELIKATAELTVRVDVAIGRARRPPQLWGNTNGPHAFHDMRHNDCLRVGTGMVCDIETQTEGSIRALKRGACKCPKCQDSETPNKVWGVVKIIVSTEVVSGDAEARQTSCRLFYDMQDSPVFTLGGWTVEEADAEHGWMVLKCVTCDIPLLTKLEAKWKHWRYNMWEKVNNKFKGSRDEHKLVFIVSHPHGYRKKISVGNLIKRYEVDDGWIKYTYTTPTCPGSSGAFVHLLGYSDWDYRGRIVHSGVNSKGTNFSCAGVKVD